MHHSKFLSKQYHCTRLFSSKPTTTWERSARLVKDTSSSSSSNHNPYLETIRATHDPSLHLKTIEDELKGTIGKALGRQGEKILDAMRRMEQELEHHERLLKSGASSNSNKTLLQESAQRYNQHRADAIQYRWELMVHRQAAGFTVNNHKYVMDCFPIPEALVVVEDNESGRSSRAKENDPTAKKDPILQDQLDWWQRIGRWK